MYKHLKLAAPAIVGGFVVLATSAHADTGSIPAVDATDAIAYIGVSLSTVLLAVGSAKFGPAGVVMVVNWVRSLIKR